MQELILVVDDEPKVVQLARDYLEKNGFRVLSADDGPSALALSRRERPDLIVLDLLLPGMDGREVCRELRKTSGVPIIMLTALSEETDQIVGLELGADDYIVKPFSPNALVARVRALLRRAQNQFGNPEVIRARGLTVDIPRHTVALDEAPVHLTPSEFKLLTELVRHPGQTLSREQLLDSLHGFSGTGFDRSIDSHIKNLRRKLEGDPEGGRYIETVYGIGYRFLG
ncbi:MAG TPA: response regulator transcription factor [Anaerolineales bacterium]|nr:response regulator transcription factor [Anaerolineales bacterium]